MKTYIISLIFALVFFAQNSFAAISIEEFFGRLKASDAQIKTLKATFTQKTFFEETGETQNAKGEVFLIKPKKIYINQQEPQAREIYVDGKDIIIYTPQNKQAIKNVWKNVIDGDFTLTFALNFANERKNIEKTNNLTLSQETQKYFVIEIKPKNTSKDWIMEIYISKNSLQTEKAFVRSTGAVLEINFKDYISNLVLPQNLLKWSLPEDVEIIELN